MFLKALECSGEVRPKAMMNLALVQNTRANQFAQAGDLANAKESALKAGSFLDQAKPLLDALAGDVSASADVDSQRYIAQFKPLRLQVHRLTGQILAGANEFQACEEEFLRASQSFPDVPGVWDMLARVFDLQGKAEEAQVARDKISELMGK